MFDKILAKLKEQRGKNSQVSDRSLEDLAKSLEPVLTTDELLTAYDGTAAIESIAGNIRHEASEAVKNADAEAKKKADEVAKKAAEEAAKKKQNTSTEDDGEKVPAWAQAALDRIENLTNEIGTLKTEKVTTSRKERLSKSLNGLPEYFSKPILKGFENTSFENDEKFDEYLTEIESNRDSFVQEAKERGLNVSAPSVDIKVPKPTGETSELAEARQVLDKQKQKQNAQKTA